MDLHFLVARAVAVRDASGRIRPPGGTSGIVLAEPNGSTTAVLATGDAFDVVHGREELVVFSTTPANALRLAWFVLWTWWVKATWCGIKLRLWRWALVASPREERTPTPPFRDSRVRVVSGSADG